MQDRHHQRLGPAPVGHAEPGIDPLEEEIGQEGERRIVALADRHARDVEAQLGLDPGVQLIVVLRPVEDQTALQLGLRLEHLLKLIGGELREQLTMPSGLSGNDFGGNNILGDDLPVHDLRVLSELLAQQGGGGASGEFVREDGD